MSLYAGIHVNDGSIPVEICIFIKLWSPKKGNPLTNYKPHVYAKQSCP